jgi:hypothetical protein
MVKWMIIWYKVSYIVYCIYAKWYSLCLDRREIILSQIQSCEKLLRYTKDKTDIIAIKKEILLKLILDLICY